MNDSTAVLLGAATLVLFAVLYVWCALALAAVFAKAGEATWKAWIPVVNAATVLALGGFSPWLVLLNVIPLFGSIAFVVVWVIAVYRITVAFGRGAGMTALGALIPVVWASILGFGDARWEGGPVRRSGGVDEESAPVRRRQDFDGPYVPLVGGWIPEPERSSSDADAEPRESSGAAPEPIDLLFAAPSSSRADAEPSPAEWMPLTPATAPDRGTQAPAEARESAVVPAGRDDSAAVPGAWESVSEALAALRAPDAREEETDDGARDSESDSEEGAPVAWRGPARRGRESDEANSTVPIADVPLTRPAPPAPVAAPVPSRHDHGPGEEFPELSEAVSAVPEAPQAGAPRSARTSVSALYSQPEFASDSDDDDLDALDRTVVTRRRRIPWVLIAPNGTPVDLTSDVVILGRRPAPDGAHPEAQLVAIVDDTRTVSKTHARLQLRGETWFVTDLDSTNGVLFATLMGTEVEAPPGEEIEAGERFFLGDAEVRLARRQP